MAMTAASGRYMRCSAATSVETGTRLDDGARITKNQIPGSAIGKRRASATIVPAASAESTRTCGSTAVHEAAGSQPY